MELDLIFKIAGIGIIVSVLNMVLKKADREEYCMIVTIAGLPDSPKVGSVTLSPRGDFRMPSDASRASFLL